MTCDFYIGRLDWHYDPDWGRNFRSVVWDFGNETDGSDGGRAFEGRPIRCVGWNHMDDFMAAAPCLADLMEGHWDRGLIQITQAFADAVAALPLPPEHDYNRQRIIWLQYWVRRAREAYGDAAAIRTLV